MMVYLLIASCIALSWVDSSTEEQWSDFKKQHNKLYLDPIEDMIRRSIFEDNLLAIKEHNIKHEAGLVSFKMRINKFADFSPEEVSDKLNGFNKKSQLRFYDSKGSTYLPPANVELPEHVDWRLEGAVTPVKDQGFCGSCWAFSATGSMEGQLFRKTGKLVPLSEQQLIDCSDKNAGCEGGLMTYAFEYIKEAGGLASEESYPYQGEEGDCKFPPLLAVNGTSLKSYIDLPYGDEEALQSAVATVGPVSVAIAAGSFWFMLYGGGIFSGKNCDPTKLNHGVLVVGYGTEEGQDYWIVKNSWGTWWGDGGYMKLERNAGSACGIASYSSFPIL